MSIPSKTSNRENEIRFRVFVDLGGKKHVNLTRGQTYPTVIRDDYSRYTWMDFMSHRSDAADPFAKIMCPISEQKRSLLSEVGSYGPIRWRVQ